jgi:isoleucyl-tRNA synthetase
MDKNDLRGQALEAIKKVQWVPGWGQERISSMIGTRPDWCISRQRVWGVPIVVFYCDQCGEALTDRKYLDPVVELFAERTSDVWYDSTEAELLGPEARCHKCGGGKFRKGTDILDVWFDSGSSHLAVLSEAFGLPWPCDLYIEGPDQYRGWFNSSLLIGVGLKGGSPYRGCATHGWTLDGEGRAMSKSVGNIIEPEKIVKQYGAEVLRLWVASQEFTEDVRISETILARLSEAYRKLRNTFRYALGNLSDFDPATDALPAGELLEMDQWILLQSESLVKQCRAWYDELAFHKVYHAVYDFSITELSSLYFDVIKDRLYTAAPRSRARRSAQTVLYRLTYALVRLLSPILTFTTEEVWGHIRKAAGEAESVHLSLLPEPGELTQGLTSQHRKRAKNWDRLMEVRDTVLKSLEAARQEKFIGAPLEACLHLRAGGDLHALLQQHAADLPALFIVSQVQVESQPDHVLSVHVARAAGVKCERCWKYTTDVGSVAELPTVCGPCAAAVAEILGN